MAVTRIGGGGLMVGLGQISNSQRLRQDSNDPSQMVVSGGVVSPTAEAQKERTNSCGGTNERQLPQLRNRPVVQLIPHFLKKCLNILNMYLFFSNLPPTFNEFRLFFLMVFHHLSSI